MTQSPWISRRVKWAPCWLIFIPLVFTPPPHAKAGQDATRLELGRPLERMIGGLDTHRYRIALSPGLYLRIAIAQRGIDVGVTVLDPAGRRVAQIDRPNGPYGPETVSVIAEAEGDYLIEVRTAQKLVAPAKYLITATERREATAEDRRRVAAEYAVSEAEELRFRETADSLSQAVEKFSQAINIWRSLGERYEEAIAVYGRGWSYRLLGDYYNAICDLHQAASQLESLQDRHGEAVARSWLAWTYIDVGENEQALERFRQALPTYESLGNLRGQAVTLYGIGTTYALTSEPEKALEYFERSLELRRKAGDRSGEVLTLSAIGMTYNYLGRPEMAIDYSQRSLELSHTMSSLQIRVNPLSKLGWAHLTLRHLDESRDYYEQALRICQSIGDRASEIPVRYGLAQVEMERGRLDEARRHIEASLEIVESLRERNSSLELRSTYLALKQDHYQLYIELLMRLHRGNPTAGHASAALQVIERACARRLLDANVRETIDLLDETRATIKRTNPGYAALTQPQLVSVERIQRELLDDGTLLLEYALGEERSYLFLVSPSSLQTFPLTPRAEIDARSRRVDDLLSARAWLSRGGPPRESRARLAKADAEL